MSSFSRYNEAHEDPQGAGDARPTAQQIIDDEGLRDALGDKVILITGCSAGIGIETARALLTTGARIFMTSRNIEKGEGVRQGLLKDNPLIDPSRLQLIQMDNASLDSVRKAVKIFMSKSDELHVLINNAGKSHFVPTRELSIAMPPPGKTKDGFETQFGVNHLAHFFLFQLLKPILLASSCSSFQSRVINVSSAIHLFGSVQLDDYNFESEYKHFESYASSKTANIWMSNELERRYGNHGIHSLSLHPGGIRTGLLSNFDPGLLPRMEMMLQDPDLQRTLKTPEQGAATTVLAAVGKGFEGVGGLYMEDCKVGQPRVESDPAYKGGYAPWAYDREGESKLWKDSAILVGTPE